MSNEIEKIKKKLEEHEQRLTILESVYKGKSQKKINKKLSIKEFIISLKPKDDVQITLAIGYFLEKYKKYSTFNARDIERGFKDAKEKIPSNPSDKIQKNISKGHIMDAKEKKDNKKAYLLTNSGERFVENNLKIK